MTLSGRLRLVYTPQIVELSQSYQRSDDRKMTVPGENLDTLVLELSVPSLRLVDHCRGYVVEIAVREEEARNSLQSKH